jgi:hypothetical protein
MFAQSRSNYYGAPIMDPVSLATVTAALTVLATECTNGVAGNAGEDVWTIAKSLMGWESDPSPADLATSIASQLNSDDKLAVQIVDLLKSTTDSEDSAAALVSKVESDSNIVIARRIDVRGDFGM